MKTFRILVLALLVCMCLSGCGIPVTGKFDVDSMPMAAGGSQNPISSPMNDKTVILTFTGDMNMASEIRNFGGGFNRYVEEVGYSYFLQNVAPIFQADDFTIVDVENVLTDQALGQVDKGDEGYAYWYRSAAANAKVLSSAGVEIGSVANNHTMDFGQMGYEDTCAALEAENIQWGDDYNPIVVEKDGFTIGILCCKLFNAGHYKNVMAWLEQAVQTTDYQVIFYHGGTERQYTPDPYRVQYSHQMIDSGADLVVGDHPHVIQPMEQYHGKYIVYSMGNFLFGGATICENPTIIFQMKLTITNDLLAAEEPNIIPCYCYTKYNPYQPALITDEVQIEQVIKFMYGQADTPETPGSGVPGIHAYGFTR